MMAQATHLQLIYKNSPEFEFRAHSAFSTYKRGYLLNSKDAQDSASVT